MWAAESSVWNPELSRSCKTPVLDQLIRFDTTVVLTEFIFIVTRA